MSLNTDKIDDAALALLYLTLHAITGPGKDLIGECLAVCTTRA